ncbi:MAG: glycoside hydrolase family 172 protein [Devosia sp.]
MSSFNGLGMSLGTLSRVSYAQSRSISPENFNGAPNGGARATVGTGAIHARDLGAGWKISPSVEIAPGTTFEVANIDGMGAIQQIWMTPARVAWRDLIIRIYWDGQAQPSVESPLGDFFANGWGTYAHVNSLAVCVNPGRAFNCYWEMPFRTRARITVENRDPTQLAVLYYQVNYTLTEVPEDCAYFHAQFRRTNPLPYGEVYTLLDGVNGQGHYVGTYMAWQVNNNGWWGEGEIKFYMDGDEHPTICGTGTEDYFCGAYNFDIGSIDPRHKSQYSEFTTAYAGMPQVIKPDGVYQSQQRFGLYRWHIVDPIRFTADLKVTIQALGWRTEPQDRRYLPLQDDIASVAYWYQTLPSAPLAPLPGRDYCELI